MNELIERFRKELLEIRLLADNTVGIYTTSLYRYVEYARFVLHIDPLKPTADHLNRWIKELKEHTSFSRIENYQSSLKSFFTFLMKLGIMDHNPASMLLPVRRAMSSVQAVSNESAFKLLDAFDRSSWTGERDYLIVSMLWALGLRVSELVSLKIEDFDPACDAPSKIGLLLVRGKGRKNRSLFVVDKLYENLVGYLERPEIPKEKSRPMFPTDKGTAISIDRLRCMVRQTALKAGITETITPHMLRHSFATVMYHQGVPVEAICDMMGHETVAETGVYIHVSDEFKKQALEKISIPGGPDEHSR
jgi:integrase/recombinase XerD